MSWTHAFETFLRRFFLQPFRASGCVSFAILFWNWSAHCSPHKFLFSPGLRAHYNPRTPRVAWSWHFVFPPTMGQLCPLFGFIPGPHRPQSAARTLCLSLVLYLGSITFTCFFQDGAKALAYLIKNYLHRQYLYMTKSDTKGWKQPFLPCFQSSISFL